VAPLKELNGHDLNLQGGGIFLIAREAIVKIWAVVAIMN